MPIIAIANQKGGVGKTTSAVTIASGFALKGYKTLLVDLDSQGNVCDSLGLDPGGDLYDLLIPGTSTSLQKVTTPSGRRNLDVVRSAKNTGALKISLSGVDFREFVLANALDNHSYDVVFLDCAPSLDLLHTAALIASDYLIIPTKLSQLSINGILETVETLKMIKAFGRKGCRLLGILPTFYERVTTESKMQLANLRSYVSEQLFLPIPIDKNCPEAVRFRQTLWEYAPKCRALFGVKMTNGKYFGGYIQAINHLLEEIR